VTHEAIKTATAANCAVCWVGEDSLLFYAAGFLPTADTRNLKAQMALACDGASALKVARMMFAKRFPDADLEGKSLNSMMGMEGVGFARCISRKRRSMASAGKGVSLHQASLN
jgi:CRISPR-associated protein Cas1